MAGRRFYLCFGLMSIGTAIAFSLTHVGADVLIVSTAAFGALGLASLLFEPFAKIISRDLAWRVDFVAICLALTRAASAVSSLYRAAIGAAGVGLLAALPIGAGRHQARWRDGAFAQA